MPSWRKFSATQRHGLALDFVDGQKDRLAAAHQQAHQVVVGAGQLSARVDHQHQRVGFFQRHFGLVVDFGGDQLGIVGHDAARVDQPKSPAGPLVFAVDAVAGDAGLVAHNGAAAVRQPVEERGFAHIGPAHNGHQRQRVRAGCGGYNRSAIRRQNNLQTWPGAGRGQTAYASHTALPVYRVRGTHAKPAPNRFAGCITRME